MITQRQRQTISKMINKELKQYCKDKENNGLNDNIVEVFVLLESLAAGDIDDEYALLDSLLKDYGEDKHIPDNRCEVLVYYLYSLWIILDKSSYNLRRNNDTSILIDYDIINEIMVCGYCSEE